MVGLLQPLSSEVQIVDDKGRPTPEFMRMLAKLRVGTGLTKDAVGNIGFAAMAAKTILANKTAGTASPTACTISDILDFITTTRGSILFRGASGWQALTPGTALQLLQTNGPGADPTWVTPSSGGGGPEYYGTSIIASTSSNVAAAYVPSGATVPSTAANNAGNLSITFTLSATSNIELEFHGIMNKSSGTSRLYIADNTGTRIWPNTLAGDLSNWSIGSRQSVAGFNGQQIYGKGIISMAAGTYTLVVWYDHVSAVGNVIWHDRMLKARVLV